MRPENKLAIEFDNAFVENSTRAADINATNLADFGVYGSIANANGTGLTFDNTKVYKDGDVYKYSPAQVWASNATYTFAAFAPYTDRQWSYAVTNNQAYNGVITFNNAAAQANQDLLFAAEDRTTEVINTKPEAVALTFNHMLSRVKFHFTNSFHAGSNIALKVTEVTITDAHSTGTLAVTNGQVADDWTVGTEKFSRNFGDVKTTLAENGGNGETEHFYLIPTEGEFNVTFKVRMTVAEGAYFDYTHNAVLKINMEKGHSYVVKTALNQTNTDPQGEMYAIEFKVEKVEDWQDFSDVALEAKTVATAQELAAAVAEGGEIRLTEDINLDAIATTRATFGLFIEKDCVIDGNGYTITTTASRGIAVSGVNNVTLKNFTLQATGERGIQVQGAAKNVTIENVTAVSANYTVNLTSSAGATVVTINNCDLKGLNTVNVAAPGSKVTVNNTTLRTEDNNNAEGYSTIAVNKDATNAIVNMNGGEIIITGTNSEDTNGGSIQAEGGNIIFKDTKGNTTIKGCYFAIIYGDYWYSFPTFEAALAKAVEGETIVLLRDVNLTEPVVITKEVIVDLNGKKISSATDVFEVADGALTIIGDGEVHAATTNGEPYCAVWAYGDAVVNIYGGTYKIGYPDGDYNDLIYAKENAVINIYGGTFYNSGSENAFVLNLKDQDRSTADINVYGGSYEKFNPANNESEGPNTNFVAAGYTVEQNGDWYIVK